MEPGPPSPGPNQPLRDRQTCATSRAFLPEPRRYQPQPDPRAVSPGPRPAGTLPRAPRDRTQRISALLRPDASGGRARVKRREDPSARPPRTYGGRRFRSRAHPVPPLPCPGGVSGSRATLCLSSVMLETPALVAVAA